MAPEPLHPVFQPSTRDEALELLASSRPALDTPTHLRHRTSEHLRTAFDAGRRRPDWVWAVRGRRTGVVAALGSPSGEPWVLDLFGLTSEPAADTALLRRASEAARSLGVQDAAVFGPTDALQRPPERRELVDLLMDAGWKPLVDRWHYELAPTPGLSDPIALDLDLRPLTNPADPALLQLMRSVVEGSLDAHDRRTIERRGVSAATGELVSEVLAHGVDAVRLAFSDDAGPVGIVSQTLAPGDRRGAVAFVGVHAAWRGRGFAAQLVAAATRHLVASGATTLVADTDVTNTPMAQAFRRAGWTPTESRTDLTSC